MALTQRTPRNRSARAVSNDRAIRDAAIAEILRVGVDHLSLRDVGHRAGLTHGATYARYENVDELLVDLWHSNLRECALSMFEVSMKSAYEPDAQSVRAVVDLVRDATPAHAAAIHLLLTARRIPTLHEEVAPFIEEYLMKEDCRSVNAEPRFTRGLTVLAVVLAKVIATYHFEVNHDGLELVEGILLESLTSDPTHVKRIAPSEARSPFARSPDGDLRSMLANSTFQVVGHDGYTNATMSRIARRANCSPGSIYTLFSSKEDLVVTSYLSAMQPRWTRIAEFVSILDEGVLSQYLYDISTPINSVYRDFVLEFALAASFSPEMKGAFRIQMTDLTSVLPSLAETAEREKNLLTHMIRLLLHLNLGVTFLSAITGTFECNNFSQFTEPFRQAILNRARPSWSQLCRQLLWFNESRNA